MTKPVGIVTGASCGVGKAVALLLAEKGWNLTLTCSSSLKEAKKVAKECNDLGAETIVLTADVSDESKCKETVQKNGKTVCANTLIKPEFTGDWFGRIQI